MQKRSFYLYGLLAGSVLSVVPALGWAMGSDVSVAQASHVGSDTSTKDTVQSVEVTGNQRVETQTILSYLGIKSGDLVDQNDLNRAMKDVFATGFFADVQVRYDAGKVSVEIVENPVVNQVFFEGNSSLETSKLEAELQLKARAVYTRPKVQEDLARVLELYRRSGRFSASVTPKVIQREQNRVDIVYEVVEGDVTRIQHINFIGNEGFSASTLRGVVRSSERCWYCFLSDNDKYDPDRMEYDKELLRKFYTSQGYADFKVKTSLAELSDDKKDFYLTFTIDEGKKYTLNKVDVVSALGDGSTENLSPLVTTKVGATYDASEIETSIDKLVEELGNRGFAFVDIEPELKRNPASQTLDLVYNIKEGPRVYVEKINITGNQRTLDEVIRREFRLAEGDPFNTSKLQRTEQRLKNLRYFDDVKITQVKGSSPDRVVINVAVQEMSTGEISLGAGYSTTDGALADFGVRERNLLGRGQDLKFKATIATQRQQYDVGFTEPYFLNRELSAGVDLFKITQDFTTESSFDRETNGGRLRAGYSLSEHLKHSLYYSLEQVNITNVDSNASRYIRDQEGTNVTSMIGQSLTYDMRNNNFDPTDGYMLKLTQEVAGLGGDSKFLRHEAKGSYYYPLTKDFTFMLAGTGGHVFGLNNEDVRINDRFFVGGRTFRGFNNAGIGPRDINTRDALGGNAYYVGTAEVTFPLGLPDDLGFRGAVFTDAGSLFSVDESGSDVVDDSALRASYGVGVLWKSPFGPIRLDFAKAYMKEKYDETETFRFNFGTAF
jgi:outer membrane protein insertion porin family